MAVRLDTPFSAIEDRIGPIIKDVAKVISFGIGRTNDERAEHVLFDDGDAWRESDMEAYRQKAVTQLGTVGSGNHYVDLMRDESGFVWIGVRFGSRGLGHTRATRYLKAAGGKDGMNVPPAVLDEDSELGRRYIAAMQLAGRYSYAGREWVIERVRKIIGGAVTDMVHNHHNYAWRETHDGRDLWVVRKGATPAFPGQRGFVGGSMGDDAVILEGVEGPEARRPARLFIRPCTAPAGCSAVRKPSAASPRRRWTDGYSSVASRWSAPISTKARWLTGGSPKCSPIILVRFACCTPSGRSPLRWPEKANSTHSRTEAHEDLCDPRGRPHPTHGHPGQDRER
jgi:tRNA-splicing ligase RtcB